MNHVVIEDGEEFRIDAGAAASLMSENWIYPCGLPTESTQSEREERGECTSEDQVVYHVTIDREHEDYGAAIDRARGSSMTEQPNCEQRIGDHLRGRMADIRTLVSVAAGRGFPTGHAGEATSLEELDLPVLTDDSSSERIEITEDEQQDAAIDRLREYPLAVSVRTVFRVDLSTGGPGDWFEVSCTGGEERYGGGYGIEGREPLEVESITYHFNDWFDHAERQLSDFDGEFAEVEEFVRMLVPELS